MDFLKIRVKIQISFYVSLMAISLRRKYMEHLDFFSSFYY